jgi:branched-chain amino acid transport system permease protein
MSTKRHRIAKPRSIAVILDLLINGIVQGSLLALICIGYSLAYGTARVINFAHADVMVFGGGYLVLFWVTSSACPLTARIIMPAVCGIAAAISTRLFLKSTQIRRVIANVSGLTAGLAVSAIVLCLRGRLSFIAASLLAIPITGMVATAIYRMAYMPLLRRDAPRTSVLISALGLSIATESVLLVAWGSERRVFSLSDLPSALAVVNAPGGVQSSHKMGSGLIALGPSHLLPIHDVLIVIVFLFVAAGLILFFRTSHIADSIVATADSKIGARACGIPVYSTLGWAFFIGGAIASIGGTLYVLRSKSLDPMAGFTPGVLAFAACVLGGIGSLRGSIAGAYLVSLVTSIAPAISLDEWARAQFGEVVVARLPSLNMSDWSYGVVYVLMIIVILFRPRGLFQK